MTAIEALLTGLFDYAGLYPPASLGMRVAVDNYAGYMRGPHSWALGRFIVNLDRVDELRDVAGGLFDGLSWSVVATQDSDWGRLSKLLSEGVRIDALEIKCRSAAVVERVWRHIPDSLVTYFEVGMDAAGREALQTIGSMGARAKIRMGGVVADAIPSAKEVEQSLDALAGLHLPFKATAGLHHPLRSEQRLTYQPESPTETMHGFINLCCAAAMSYFGESRDNVVAVLSEQDPSSFRVSCDTIQWHDQNWTVEQLAELRDRFLISIGSCSFEEPIEDLESLRWL